MNGRLYDPVLARLLSPDNYVMGTTNTQGFNRYIYALNNPLKYTDSTGNFILEIAGMTAIAGFIKGFKSEGGGFNNKANIGWNRSILDAAHGIKISGGLWQTNPHRNFLGQS